MEGATSLIVRDGITYFMNFSTLRGISVGKTLNPNISEIAHSWNSLDPICAFLKCSQKLMSASFF